MKIFFEPRCRIKTFATDYTDYHGLFLKICVNPCNSC